RVMHTRCHTRFVDEHLGERRVARVVAVHALDGDDATEARGSSHPRDVDGGHAAPADLAVELVATNDARCGRRFAHHRNRSYHAIDPIARSVRSRRAIANRLVFTRCESGSPVAPTARMRTYLELLLPVTLASACFLGHDGGDAPPPPPGGDDGGVVQPFQA